MKKTVLIFAASLGLYALSSGALAIDNPHRVGLSGGIASLDLGRGDDDATREVLDLNAVHLSVNYDYLFTKSLGLGVGYLEGDSNDFTFFISLYNDTRMEYDALYFGPRFQLPLGEVNGLYLNVNILDYNFDVIDNDQVIGSDDGTGYGASFGWNLTLRNGIGVKVGYEILNLGDDVEMKGIEAGVSYSF
ncbi:MAG: hypothetical protein COA42_21210 [Alteromonadaceae bacterium]|nr:MAG: hypothetical protein COA42_21210 [Alteromonadaceae bacterium]